MNESDTIHKTPSIKHSKSMPTVSYKPNNTVQNKQQPTTDIYKMTESIQLNYMREISWLKSF